MHRSLASFAIAYDTDTPPELVIPEDLGREAVSDEDLGALHEQAVAAFDELYGDGSGLTEDDLATLTALTDGIDRLRTEIEARAAAEHERAENAAALAQRVRPSDPDDEEGDEEDEEDEEEDDSEGEVEGPHDEAPEEVAASAHGRGIRVNLSGLARRQARRPAPAQRAADELSMADIIVAAADVPGYAPGQGLSWNDVGRIIDRRLMGFNEAQFDQAVRAKRSLRQQYPVLTVQVPYGDELTISNNDPAHIEEVLNRACSEARLPGNSLVAAGNQGWCAPSTIIYDLCEMETRDGLFSLPTITVTRGGIQFTMGPDFADIYNSDIGFCFTEEDDKAGLFGPPEQEGGPNTEGDKPCYEIGCPDFEDHRMGVCGLCLTAGLLQMRGYPEMIARVTRGALVAHDHRMSARILAQLEAESTAITMPSRAGAIAPLLDAIELQVEHYRYIHRAGRGTTLEAVFPFWVRGAVRADLARRLGIWDAMNVTDGQIAGWFAARGVAPQFVWNWQDITGDAENFTEWPSEVKFLLYGAGTWVSARTPIITLDTVFDTAMVRQNRFTALFTEEGFLVAQRCHDSRVVTVPICPDGATHGGIDIACNGAAA